MSKSNNDSSQIKFLSKVVEPNYVVNNNEMIKRENTCENCHLKRRGCQEDKS